MKDVRFRAWVYDPDLEEYVMKDVAKLDFYLDTFEISMVYTLATVQRKPTEFTFVPYDIKDVILMQDTGLKDKNNKKIYDGDILRFSNENIGKVFLSNLRAGFDVAFNGAIPEELDAGLADRSEVLGNIHENKELINETIEI